MCRSNCWIKKGRQKEMDVFPPATCYTGNFMFIINLHNKSRQIRSSKEAYVFNQSRIHEDMNLKRQLKRCRTEFLSRK